MGSLTDFLRQQKQAGRSRSEAKKLSEWRDALDVLFKQILSWLAEAEREKLIKISKSKVTLTEGTLSGYGAPCLILTAGAKTVKFRPKGFKIIGADGRVDMEFPNGTYMLLYLSDKKRWVHGFGKRPADFPELTEELFVDLLKKALS